MNINFPSHSYHYNIHFNNQKNEFDIRHFLTNTTSPEEFDNLCNQNPEYQLTTPPRNNNYSPNEIRHFESYRIRRFERAAVSAISLKNNRLLLHILNKVGKDLMSSESEISLLRFTLEEAFSKVDEENELYAYHAVRKMIQFGAKVNDSPLRQTMCPYNGLLDKALRTGNVALVSLMYKNHAKSLITSKDEIGKYSTKDVSTMSSAIVHIIYQQTIRSKTMEAILFRLSLGEQDPLYTFTPDMIKIISGYCRRDAHLDEDLDREIFISYVINTFSTPFSRELTKIILEYAGNYDAV